MALACTTADRFSAKLKMHGERISYIAGDTWRALDETAFTRIHKHLRGVKVPACDANTKLMSFSVRGRV